MNALTVNGHGDHPTTATRSLGSTRPHRQRRRRKVDAGVALVYGTKKDAKLVTAELTVKPACNAGGRKLRQLLDEWINIKTPGWADLTIRDQTSRAKPVAADPIGNMSVASIGVSDVDRWVGRLRKAGLGEGAIRNPHTVLRSALQQAVRWSGSRPTRLRTLQSTARSANSTERSRTTRFGPSSPQPPRSMN